MPRRHLKAFRTMRCTTLHDMALPSIRHLWESPKGLDTSLVQSPLVVPSQPMKGTAFEREATCPARDYVANRGTRSTDARPNSNTPRHQNRCQLLISTKGRRCSAGVLPLRFPVPGCSKGAACCRHWAASGQGWCGGASCLCPSGKLNPNQDRRSTGQPPTTAGDAEAVHSSRCTRWHARWNKLLHTAVPQAPPRRANPRERS